MLAPHNPEELVMWSARLLALATWLLAAACSGGRDETRDGGSAASEDQSPTPSAEPAPAQPAPAQPESFSRGTVPMTIVAKVDGTTHRASGPGECASSADASIYGVPATLWHATYEGAAEPRRLNLTVWRPRTGGGDMVGLSLTIGETNHQIVTVKGGQLAGSGTPGVRPAGSGGTLTLTGKDDHGDAIELSVECARFDEVVAEGG
jgi:hypothetical protein